jgi:hypothetical protein
MPTITNKPTHTSFLERCTGLSLDTEHHDGQDEIQTKYRQ